MGRTAQKEHTLGSCGNRAHTYSPTQSLVHKAGQVQERERRTGAALCGEEHQRGEPLDVKVGVLVLSAVKLRDDDRLDTA